MRHALQQVRCRGDCRQSSEQNDRVARNGEGTIHCVTGRREADEPEQKGVKSSGQDGAGGALSARAGHTMRLSPSSLRRGGAIRGTHREPLRSSGVSGARRQSPQRPLVEDFDLEPVELTPSAVGGVCVRFRRFSHSSSASSSRAHPVTTPTTNACRASPVWRAVLSSDALSSVAYATEDLARPADRRHRRHESRHAHRCRHRGHAGRRRVSYRRTIHAYPSGGGAYLVAKENLGTTPSLVAASSLLIDYVLTVAVSVAPGWRR